MKYNKPDNLGTTHSPFPLSLRPKYLYAIFLVSLAAAEKHEVVVPKTLYTHRSYCPGEDVSISCAIDGAPFKDYQLISFKVDVFYTAAAANQAG